MADCSGSGEDVGFFHGIFQCDNCACSFLGMDEFLKHDCKSSGQHVASSAAESGEGELHVASLYSDEVLAFGHEQPAMCSLDNQNTCRPPSSLSTCSSSSTDVERLERWEDRHVKLLIACYSECKHRFGKGKSTKKVIFGQIASYFNAKCDIKVTGEQCMRKWVKLENKFKEVEDHNKITGNDRKTMKFYDEMSACIGKNPKVTPALILESAEVNSGSSDDASEDTSTENAENDAKRPRKRPTRKRKSYSSAAEMLSFLHTYGEERKKVEEEKLNLMREMKEEKNTFFTQFLDIMKNK